MSAIPRRQSHGARVGSSDIAQWRAASEPAPPKARPSPGAQGGEELRTRTLLRLYQDFKKLLLFYWDSTRCSGLQGLPGKSYAVLGRPRQS